MLVIEILNVKIHEIIGGKKTYHCWVLAAGCSK
jgi:hypothetical protein